MNYYKKYSSYTLLITIIALHILVLYLINIFLITNEYIINTYSNTLSYERILVIIDSYRKLEWLGYLWILIIYNLKFLIVALSLYIVFIFYEIDDEVSFKQCYKTILLAEIIPLIYYYFNLIFLLTSSLKIIEHQNKFINLSIQNIIDFKNLPPYLHYPLQQINLFEIGYWLVLAFLIKLLIHKPFLLCLKFVALSYGTCFIIWVLFVMFLQIHFS